MAQPLRRGLLAAVLVLAPGLAEAQDAPPGPKLPDMPSLRQKGSDDPTKPAGALPPPARPAPKPEEKKPEPARKAEPKKAEPKKPEAKTKSGAKKADAKPAKGSGKKVAKGGAKRTPLHAAGKRAAAKPKAAARGKRKR